MWDRLYMQDMCVGGASPEPAIELASYVSGSPIFLAALVGQLAVVDGCLVVGDEAGRRHQLVVFPAAETIWDGQVLLYGGRRYRCGDLLEVCGGFMELARLDGLRVPQAWVSAKKEFVVAPSVVASP